VIISKSGDLNSKTVLVIDTDRGSAIAVIRSLGRRGWRVIAADSNPRSLGFRSRYVDQHFVYPDPSRMPNEFVDLIFQKTSELNVKLVIPITDQVIYPIAHVRHRFDGLCQLAIGEASALEQVKDKSKTLKLAERLDIPVPTSRVVNTVEEARVAMESLSWPVVIKPTISQNFRPNEGTIETGSVCYANDLDALESRMQEFEGRHKILLQTYCPGIGYGVELLAYKGKPLAAFQHKRLAEIPLTGGASAWRESVALDPQLFDYAKRMVSALGWTGLIMVEFKVGNDVRLMEINGRVWGSLPLAVQSGMDFPAHLADLYLDPTSHINPLPACDYKLGVRACNTELMLSWMIQVLLGMRRYAFLTIPKRREALAAAVGLLTTKFDIGFRGDPQPGFAEIAKIARKFTGKLTAQSVRSD
jgi:predicted ATP-grasp superfamily ATP-dependent carboligase